MLSMNREEMKNWFYKAIRQELRSSLPIASFPGLFQPHSQGLVIYPSIPRPPLPRSGEQKDKRPREQA